MKRTRGRGLLSLVACIAALWIFSGYFLPFVTNSFEATRSLAAYIDESGIETGQFYYTGVESTTKAETGARASMAFWETRRSIAERDTTAGHE